MKTYTIPHTTLDVSRIGYGCMRLGGSWDDKALTQAEISAAIEVVSTAFDAGITLFDHADIYSRGKSERVFAEVLRAYPEMRSQIVLQSKCGIRFADDPEPGAPGRYDFSYDHIVASVEGSLHRLETDYLDILLLHRPDPLMEPEEVARAFDDLHTQGKVRYVGVSNHTPAQIDLLQSYVAQPIVVNQIELSLLHAQLINAGIVFNRDGADDALTGGALDRYRLKDIMIQAWSPVAGGRLFNPPAAAPANIRELSRVIAGLADELETTPEAIALAWLLRHPAGIQPIIGTTQPDRVQASARADQVTLTREAWYRLFVTARGESVP